MGYDGNGVWQVPAGMLGNERVDDGGTRWEAIVSGTVHSGRWVMGNGGNGGGWKRMAGTGKNWRIVDMVSNGGDGGSGA